jgi:multimeric flavodoxin WrbA
MKRLLIVHHSRTGGTQQMADAVADGTSEEVMVHRARADLAGPEDLLDCDGVVFACPENLAAISGVMKDFFDRSYYPVLDRIQGKPYALAVCAGSDGTNVVRQVRRIAAGWRLREIAEPIIVITHAQTGDAIMAAKTIPPEDLARCRDLGATFAAGLAMGVF